MISLTYEQLRKDQICLIDRGVNPSNRLYRLIDKHSTTVSDQFKAIDYAVNEMARTEKFIWNALEDGLGQLWNGSENTFDDLFQKDFALLLQVMFYRQFGDDTESEAMNKSISEAKRAIREIIS